MPDHLLQAPATLPLQSFWMGGFEGASHRRRDGLQIDVLRAMRHEFYAAQDYSLLATLGIRTVRDALRWHRIERVPGRYDWSSFLPMLRASNVTGTQIIWDLCHWGLPSDIDIFSPTFVDRFAAFARATATVVAAESDAVPFYAPMNEVSFWSWIGGDLGGFYPYCYHAGDRLKHQLVRAAIAAIEAVRSVDPRARFLQPEPLIHIARNDAYPETDSAVAAYNNAQFAVFDLLSGRLPQCGGAPQYLDIIGVNYYWNNQWVHLGQPAPLGHKQHRSLASMLVDLFDRYDRPMILSETGAEADSGPGWMHAVSAEVHAALDEGVPLHGICLYPICDYPGWDDDRHCPCGPILLDSSYNDRALRSADAKALQLLQRLHLLA